MTAIPYENTEAKQLAQDQDAYLAAMRTYLKANSQLRQSFNETITRFFSLYGLNIDPSSLSDLIVAAPNELIVEKGHVIDRP